jgi:hypothetical protein
MTRWIATEIITEPNPKRRVKLLSHFIAIAKAREFLFFLLWEDREEGTAGTRREQEGKRGKRRGRVSDFFLEIGEN